MRLMGAYMGKRTKTGTGSNSELNAALGVKTKTERVARLLAEAHRLNPDQLEPGDLPRIDGYMPNGDPSHFIWRQFVPLAKKVIRECSYRLRDNRLATMKTRYTQITRKVYAKFNAE